MIIPELFKMCLDGAMWIYLFTIIVCLYGAGLFGWWAQKAGNPSAVFLYVMGIFIAEGWATGVETYARWLHLYADGVGYRELLFSWTWMTRQLPVLGILSTLAIHMSVRAFSRKKQRSTDGKTGSYNGLPEQLVEASRMIAEAAALSAQIVASASTEAAAGVALTAQKAAEDAKITADRILAAIRDIHERRSGGL